MATPTRRPVNSPGPMSTAMTSMSATVHPDTAHTSSTEGISSSAWARPPAWTRSADAAVVPDQGHPDRVGGRLDGQQGHGATAHRPRAPARASHRADHGRARGSDGDDPYVVVRLAVRPPADGQGVGPEDRLGGVPPLDEGHRPVLDQLAEAQVDDLVEVVQTPDVGVQEGAHGAVPAQRILADQGEGGAGDGLGHPEAGTEPLGERGLARPRSPASRRTSPGTAHPGHRPGQGPGLVGAVVVEDQRGRGPHESQPSSCLARIRSARISATTTPPERRAAAGW